MRRQNTVAALTSVAVLPPDLAERQSYVGEFLLEGFVHVLLEVRGFDVFDDRSLQTHVKKWRSRNGSLYINPQVDSDWSEEVTSFYRNYRTFVP